MSTVAVDVQECLKPILGQRPWRARRGVGSFLTFDFGPKLRSHGQEHGTWHLWIYLARWSLKHNGRQLVTSDSEKHPISVAVRRLEAAKFLGVELEPQNSTASFAFGDFRLVVAPADYLEDPGDRDEYWLFFMPNNLVLTAGPSGIDVRPSDK